MPIQTLEIARSALAAYQTALEVTALNIANTNTPGYARRRAILVSQSNDSGVMAQTSLRGNWGVLADRIERAHDEAMGRQLILELGRWGYGDGLAGALSRTEALFDDLSGPGISDQLTQLLNASERLSLEPESLPARVEVISAGRTLADTLTNRYSDLSRLQQELDAEVVAQVGKVNRLADQVAIYNTQVARLGPEGHGSTLLDHRDQALEQLAELVGAEALAQENGMVDVVVSGRRLVMGQSTVPLLMETDPTTGFRSLTFGDFGGELRDPEGRLGGLIAARDDYLPTYLTRLDDLADGLRAEVNAIHQTAIGLDGTTGEDFFVGGPGVSGFAVNPALSDDPLALGASATGAPGDGTRALEIAALGTALTMSGGTETFGQYYAATVALVGGDSAGADEQRQASDAVVNAVRGEQQSVEGVSLDDEAINMVQYQHAYAAAARVIEITRQMMDEVLNLVG